MATTTDVDRTSMTGPRASRPHQLGDRVWPHPAVGACGIGIALAVRRDAALQAAGS